jgi:hypothetical protein
MVLTNKHYVHKEVRSRSELGQAFCHLFPSFYLFAFCQKSNKKNKTVIFPVVLYGVKLDFLPYEENSVRVFGNRVLKGIFGPEQTVVTEVGGGAKLPSEKIKDRIVHQILLG